MPSTPYAASAADTPIASAKRPKRRVQQSSVTSPARRGTARDDLRDKENDTGKCSGKDPETDAGAGSEGSTKRGVGKAAEEEEDVEAPSPPKVRKGSTSATPRASGLSKDSRRTSEEGKAARTSLGAQGSGEDQNRHNPKESSIFSPGLKPEHSQEGSPPRGHAPASTVSVSTEVQVSTDPSISTASVTPVTEKSRSKEGAAAASATAQADGSPGAGRDVDGQEQEDDEVLPELRIREVEPGVDGVFDTGDDDDDEEEEEQEDDEEFNPYYFIAHLPPYSTVKHHTPEAPALPEKRSTRHGKELTLVLDLDETLVHCTVDPIPNPDHRFEVHFNGEEFQVYVRKRPHLDWFLEAVSELFEVVVFTASQQVYAERLLNMIDPQKKWVKYRLYRDACMALEGNYLKDLNVLGRDLSKVAIVDNSPYAYGFQIDNGIPIESWFDDTTDEELLNLVPLLKQLITESDAAGGDVRPYIRNIFKTHELVDKARNGARDVGSPSRYPVANGTAATPAAQEDASKTRRDGSNDDSSDTAGGEDAKKSDAQGGTDVDKAGQQ